MPLLDVKFILHIGLKVISLLRWPTRTMTVFVQQAKTRAFLYLSYALPQRIQLPKLIRFCLIYTYTGPNWAIFPLKFLPFTLLKYFVSPIVSVHFCSFWKSFELEGELGPQNFSLVVLIHVIMETKKTFKMKQKCNIIIFIETSTGVDPLKLCYTYSIS